MLDQPIAQIEKLRVEFETKDGTVVGVEDVSFDVNPGETVCIVGESGSGKSVTSLSLMRLVEFGGGNIAGGRLLFDRKDHKETDVAKADGDLMRHIRGNEIGMIFQRVVGVGDIRLMVLVVVDFHRARVDVRFEGVVCVRKGR